MPLAYYRSSADAALTAGVSAETLCETVHKPLPRKRRSHGRPLGVLVQSAQHGGGLSARNWVPQALAKAVRTAKI